MKPTLPHRQRGAAALTVTMLLLFTTALAVFYLNRGMVFEQRTSANQVKSTSALEAAEAGLEWATGMLNAPYDIGNDCAFQTTTNLSFRKKYVMTMWNDATNPTSDIVVSNALPGCRFVNGVMSCRCPAPNTTAAPTISGTGASFAVQFTAVAAEAVRVTAWGCAATAGGDVCNPANSAAADANARVTAVIKLKPVLRAAPSSPLTCGTSCTLGGSANVQNDDVATNGVLVNAGTSIATSPGITLDTLPGQPTANALIPNDGSLSDLSSTDPTCSNSNMFKAYFGSTIEAYRKTPSTKVLSCSSASDCGSQLFSAYNDGWRAFFFDSDVHLSGNHTLGSAADPVTLVTASALDINGTWDIYGLIFSNSAAWNDLGTGTATIHGAQISCAAYSNNGNGTLTYDADALKNARRFSALMVRVPGSWKDF